MCFSCIPLLYFYGGKEENCFDAITEESFAMTEKRKGVSNLFAKTRKLGFVSDTTKSAQLMCCFNTRKYRGRFFFR